MIEVNKKEECCGCAVCTAICPRNCISMAMDKEGFIYPEVDIKECINCHLCEKACPVLNVQTDEEKGTIHQKGYIVQHKNPQVLKESTAGGAFTAIAKHIISMGGSVYGVELQDDLKSLPSAAKHVCVNNETELRKFRNSKYIQSTIETTLIRSVKKDLENGKYVCFSGTPCQVEAVKKYLDLQKIDQSKLVLVDVVCRAVPSPLIFRKYLEHQEKKNLTRIRSVRFRDKYYGYKYSTMNQTSDDNTNNYHRGIESDPYLRAFFSNICDRPSCYNCKFKKIHRISDFTIWDCFNVGRFSREMDNDKGATRVLVHTEKGQKIMASLDEDLKIQEFSAKKIIKGTKELIESVSLNDQRELFFRDANEYDGYTLFEKYFPLTLKSRLKRIIRMFCYRLGIYSVAKKMYVRVTRKY